MLLCKLAQGTCQEGIKSAKLNISVQYISTLVNSDCLQL